MTLEISLFKLKQKPSNVTDYHTSPLISDYFLTTENNITQVYLKKIKSELPG